MGTYIFKTDVDIAHEEGLNEGLNQGRTEAQTFQKLIKKLCLLKRYDDVERSSTDDEYRDKLYKEFQLA